MTKVRVLMGTLFVFGLFGLAGCSQDPNEAVISDSIATLKDTTNIIEQITVVVKGEVESSKKTGKMDAAKLLEANTKAKELKNQAERLQKIKAATDNLREGLTKEQRSALAEKHKDS